MNNFEKKYKIEKLIPIDENASRYSCPYHLKIDGVSDFTIEKAEERLSTAIRNSEVTDEFTILAIYTKKRT